jgi:transcriptional regulator with XRE-family HTH domain
MSELFDAVDALVASRSPLPPPAERRRLRQAHALTLDEVAAALGVRRATVGGWESGKAEPRPPEREAYARLLKQLATLYPAPQSTGAPQEDPSTAAPQTFTAAETEAQAGPTGGAAEATATTEAEEPPTAPPAPVRHAGATQ